MTFAHSDAPRQIDKAYLVKIHGDLSAFHEILARRTIPHSYQAPGCEMVADLMMFIEKLTDETPI